MTDQLQFVAGERGGFWCPRNCKKRCGPGTCVCPVCHCPRCRRSAAIAKRGLLYSTPEDDSENAVAPRLTYQPRLFPITPRSQK
jgi:hypothetical protein